MASNKCIKCDSAKPNFGKCPVCDEWTGSVPVDDSVPLRLTWAMFRPFLLIANLLCLFWGIMCPVLVPNNPNSEFWIGSLVFGFLWLPMTIIVGPITFGVIDYRKSCYAVFSLILCQLVIITLLCRNVGNSSWLTAMAVPSSIAVIGISMKHRRHQEIFTSYLMILTVVYGASAFLRFDPLGRLTLFQAILVTPLLLLIPITSAKILNTPNRLVPTFIVITHLANCAVGLLGLKILMSVGLEQTFRLLVLFVLSLLGLLSMLAVRLFQKLFQQGPQSSPDDDSDFGIRYAFKVFGTFVLTVLVALYFAINAVVSAGDYQMKREARIAQERAEADRKQREQAMQQEIKLQADRDRIESAKRKARQDYIDDTAEGVAKGIAEGIKRSRRN